MTRCSNRFRDPLVVTLLMRLIQSLSSLLDMSLMVFRPSMVMSRRIRVTLTIIRRRCLFTMVSPMSF